MPINPQRAVQKWKERMAALGNSFEEGVRAVTESPTAKAAAAVDKYQAGVARAVADGSFVAGLQSVSLAQWQDAMIKKGAANMRVGVQNLDARAQAAMVDEMQYAQAAAAEVRAMPNVTPGDAENRALAMMRKMREYRKPRR